MTAYTKWYFYFFKKFTRNIYKNYFLVLLVILLGSSVIVLLFPHLTLTNQKYKIYRKLQLDDLSDLPSFDLKYKELKTRNANCSHWDCFNVYKCGHTGHDRIAVYIYPLMRYEIGDFDSRNVNAISREYYELLKTILESKYYTANPNEACIFIPSVDLLNVQRKDGNISSLVLANYPFWNDGENHVIFNMYSEISAGSEYLKELYTGNAIIAGSSFESYTFRKNFDISIPLFSPVAHLGVKAAKDFGGEREWFVLSSQVSIDPYYLDEIQKLSYNNEDVLILDACHDHSYSKRCDVNSGEMYLYPHVLGNSTFCLVFGGSRVGQLVLLEAMAANCIPVVIMNEAILPFSSVIDWKRAAVFVNEDYIGTTLMNTLHKISPRRIKQMQQNVRFLYESYFRSFKKVVLTSLDIIQDRVYRHLARNYDEWNIPPSQRHSNPLFLPITVPKSQGFTAVILTYDRIDSLFTLIVRLARVPSLMKVIVIWNNGVKAPPADFPNITKPIKVIRTKANKLSNRFYPYKDIETEAILHIDDDIVMLTADEVEFGYEVWREFPDRIVGFPSRMHVWSNVTNSWKYESEWTNQISMVLTGAAFLHKYWSYLYTFKMPASIRSWVDDNMNCEDIAMNFLVANVTNQPPIKVTPRKKFKCPECTNNEMLSADMGHMVERSQCVDRFAKAFQRMPLQTVEFRADPVLFKDPFPEKLKRFNDIGTL